MVTTLEELLTVESIATDLYRSRVVLPQDRSLYGGQIAAQALHAAGLTVPSGRTPHSLHAYFLTKGDPRLPVDYRVLRDRDGHSFSARRIVASQLNRPIFTMSTSFCTSRSGDDIDSGQQPHLGHGERLEPFTPLRIIGFDALRPAGDLSDAWPVRFLARPITPLYGGELLDACAMTYLSDLYTGLEQWRVRRQPRDVSIDHALWFHRPLSRDSWTTVDLRPVSASAGRGVYIGSYWQQGRLVASLMQETLFSSGKSG